MKTEHWIQILIGGIFLGGLGYLIPKVVDMSGTLGRVDANQTSTAERVNRIAGALPDVGVRVAREEVFRAFQTAVLATIPTQTTNGSWQTTVTRSIPRRNDDDAMGGTYHYNLLSGGASLLVAANR